MLGWIIDTDALTVTLPSHKRLKLRHILAGWPSSRASASGKQVSQLVGFLIHVPFAVRPGRFFVHLRLVCRASPPELVSIAVWLTPGGVSPWDPNSMVPSSFDGGSLREGWTRAEEPCRLLFIIRLSAPLDVICFRTHLKPLSAGFSRKLGYIGDTSLTQGNGLDFVDRVSPSQMRTT